MTSSLFRRGIAHLQSYPDQPQLGLKYLHKAATLGTNPSFIASIKEVERKESEIAWSARALSSLSNFYLEGRYGLPKDIVQGCKLLEDARRLGSKAAATQLALLGLTAGDQHHGMVQYDVVKGLSVAKEVATSHDILEHTVSLIDYYQCVADPHIESNAPLQTAARAGVVGAQLRLGLSLLPTELSRAVSSASVNAAVRIGSAVWRTEASAEEGVGWICRAASSGLVRALFVCGKLLLCLPMTRVHLIIIEDDQREKWEEWEKQKGKDKDNTAENEQRASRRGYHYIEQAAQQDREAMVQLGLWHEETIDVEEIDAFGYLNRRTKNRKRRRSGGIENRRFDDARALQWYARACSLSSSSTGGHPTALLRLGRMVEQGRGVRTADQTLAGDLYARAAKQGNAEAMYALGRLHLSGCAGRALSSKSPRRFAASLEDGLDWMDRACRTEHCPSAAFCAGVVLERLADATVKQAYAGPQYSPSGRKYALRAATMYSVCVSTCSAMQDTIQEGNVATKESILLGRIAQYRLSMLLLRWDITDVVNIEEENPENTMDARYRQISTALQWLKKLGKVDHDPDQQLDKSTIVPAQQADITVALAAHAVATLYVNGIVSPLNVRGRGDLSSGEDREMTGREILQPDIVVAAGWFRLAAMAGSGSAAFNLASLYEEGRGVGIDLDIATAWYDCAGRLLLAGNHHNINDIDLDIEPLPSSSSSSSSSSSNGGWLSSFDAEREYNLGVLYMTGRGVGSPPDVKQAMKWLRKASCHRHCDAMHALAWSLLQRKRYKEALRILYQAAKEGHEPSSEAVATMYQRGLGVAPNRKKSSSWFEIAGEQRQRGLRAETMLWRLGSPCYFDV